MERYNMQIRGGVLGTVPYVYQMYQYIYAA